MATGSSARETLLAEVVKTFATSGNFLTYDIFRATCSSSVLREVGAALAAQLPGSVTVLLAPGMGAAGLAAAVALALPRPVTILSTRDPAKARGGERMVEGVPPVEPCDAAFIDDTITTGDTYRTACDLLRDLAPHIRVTCCGVLLDAWHPHGSRRIHASGIPVFSFIRRHELGLTRDCSSSAGGGPKIPTFTKLRHEFQVAELNDTRHNSNPILLHDRIVTADHTHTVRSNTLNGHCAWQWQSASTRSKGIVQNLVVQPDNTLLVAGYGGTVARLTLDGAVQWETSVSHAVHSTPTVDTDGTIYIACEEFDKPTRQPGGSLVALTSSGKLIQKVRYSEDYAPGRCTVLSSTIIITANDKVLRCVEKSNFAQEVWQLNLPGLVRGEITHAHGLLYMATESGHVMCVDSTNGDTLWSSRISRSFFNSIPMLHSGRVIVCDTSLHAHGVDIYTGKRAWIARFRSAIKQRPTVMSEDRWVFAGFDGDVHIVEPSSGKKLAQTRTDRRLYQPGSYHEGKYAVLTASGVVQVWEVNHDIRN